MDVAGGNNIDYDCSVIEKTELWITCDKPLDGDGRAIRGFFGNLFRNRPEFHGHSGQKLIYKHPLIQYKVFGGSALVVGLKEGSYLLKAVPELESLEIHHEQNQIVRKNVVSNVVPFGVTQDVVRYAFVTPWVGLNEKNYQRYRGLGKSKKGTHVLLNTIIVGNILSMCKSLGYAVNDLLYVDSELEEDAFVNVKEDVRLASFVGYFKVNFLIPDFWGIGGKVSLGYGTVKSANGGKV